MEGLVKLAIGQVPWYTVPMSTLVNAIRRAIEANDASRYRIAKDTGIAQSQLSRLVSGERGLDVDTIERLADYLGLQITIGPKTKAKTTKGR